ncbi:hypothetical protein [Streptomyces flavofungini]|uniref:hypothetical protein n=1 Tax=Streptomyces flavofungini TaxID=68200 RepID=UPI0025B1E21F|nr:hypothetical protein [Streptomyces flavofungini]WJV44535.1 hypothetical protein QUY26_02710 [Streptomyces flavofungini]
MRKRHALTGIFAISALTVGVAVSAAESDGVTKRASAQPVTTNGADESKWPSPTPERGLAKGLSLPVEKYLAGYPEVVQWQRAQRSLWVSCMARYGFENFNPPVPGVNPPAEYNDANMPRRYGISNAAEAAKYGYHLPPQQMAEPPVWEPTDGPEGTVFLGEGPELSDGTYNGTKVPEGGCRGETERQLGHLSQGEDAARVNAASLTESMQRVAVQEIISKWSACMKTRGFTLDDPYKASDQFDLSTQTASAEEIKMATADVACKEETGLVQKWHEEESALQAKQIAAKRTALESERAKMNAVKKASLAAIAKGANK